jgi:hypothetical protein
MNSGFRPIPSDMPLDRAADMMVRRGEANTFGQAKARIQRLRQRATYGGTHVTSSHGFQGVESPTQLRLPYRDD